MLKKLGGWREKAFVAGGAAVLVAAIIAAVATGTKWTDVASPAIALGALVVATAAWRQNRRSADADHRSVDIAEAQEERRRYGWSVNLHPNGSHYELRNTGTVAAQAVELGGSFMRIQFLSKDGDGRVDIAAGEARAFHAITGFSRGGVELIIDWLPEGETERRTWRETMPPMPNSWADRTREREENQARALDRQRDDMRDQRELILRLGDAYADWKTDRDNPQKKLRVQLLVAALPPSIAREIGYEVDVARDVWGDGEYPFEFHVAEEDRELISPARAEIELMWNMRQLAGYRVYGPIEAEGPSTEPRIWWAVKGYASRVRERESGERQLRRSRADQMEYDSKMQMLQQFTAQLDPPQAAAE